jgi:hypothetical protein
VYLSLKQSNSYEEVTKDDEFGRRVFYLYSTKDIHDIAVGYVIKKLEEVDLRGQKWLEIILQKEGNGIVTK